MSAAKLYYFNGRGRGAIIRLTLAACGIPFTEEFLTEKEQITKWRADGKLLFSQVPMLEIDGMQLVQSGAIVRYIARKGGIYGKNNEEAVRIDMFYEGAHDFMNYFIKMGFVDKQEVLKDASEKAMPRYCSVFNKALQENKSGYLVGDGLTLADVALLEPLLAVVDYYGEDGFKDYPAIQTFYQKMTSLDNISKFLNGPQRKKPNDEVYVSTVKKTLF